MLNTEKVVIEVVKEFVESFSESKATKSNSKELAFILEQVGQFGKEKHIAFLKRVFHNAKVSQEQFFKVLKNLNERVVAKAKKQAEPKEKTSKAKAKVAKVATKAKPKEKTSKAVAKVEPKATSKEKTSKTRVTNERSSFQELDVLEKEIAKLVKAYNDQWAKSAKVSVAINYSNLVGETRLVR